MCRPLLIAPSILAADFARLGEEVRASMPPAPTGSMSTSWTATSCPTFVRPRRGQGAAPAHQEGARRPPDDRARDPYLEAFAKAGADVITVHAEAGPHLDRSLQAIRALGKKAGARSTPAPRSSRSSRSIDIIDLILAMSVNPALAARLSFRPRSRRSRSRARSPAPARSTSRSTAASHWRPRRCVVTPARMCWSRALPCSGRQPEAIARHLCDPQRSRAGARGDGLMGVLIDGVF